MKKKLLIDTNIYLKNPKLRKELILKTAITSFKIENIKANIV